MDSKQHALLTSLNTTVTVEYKTPNNSTKICLLESDFSGLDHMKERCLLFENSMSDPETGVDKRVHIISRMEDVRIVEVELNQKVSEETLKELFSVLKDCKLTIQL